MVEAHLPSSTLMAGWPTFSAAAPLRILASACQLGVPCGTDATSYGAPGADVRRLMTLPTVELVGFYPEDVAFGTPRRVPDIVGGDGFDVLDGRARVLADDGEDWTDAMVAAAHDMVALARRRRVHLALLTDVSAACGSQVIYAGARSGGVHRPGVGVCTALLIRHGFPVMSPRDLGTFDELLGRLDPTYRAPAGRVDHHQSAWYRDTFGGSGGTVSARPDATGR
jgi:uncharacterized protein YbbK (DUF523 family)